MSGSPKRRFDHRAEPDRRREAEALFADARPDGYVDLLEMDVGDALGIVADELLVVGAAIGHVPRVKAELHGRRVGTIEEALDLLLCADVAVGVGVEGQHGAMLTGHVAAQLGHARHEGLPLVVIQFRRGGEVALEVGCSPRAG